MTVFSVVNGGQSGRATRPWARAMWSMGRTVAAESGEWVTHVLVETGPAMGAGQAVEQEVQRAAAAERGGEVAYDERGGRSVASVRRRRDGKSEGERREARTAFEGLVVMTGGLAALARCMLSSWRAEKAEEEEEEKEAEVAEEERWRCWEGAERARAIGRRVLWRAAATMWYADDAM